MLGDEVDPGSGGIDGTRCRDVCVGPSGMADDAAPLGRMVSSVPLRSRDLGRIADDVVVPSSALSPLFSRTKGMALEASDAITPPLTILSLLAAGLSASFSSFP